MDRTEQGRGVVGLTPGLRQENESTKSAERSRRRVALMKGIPVAQRGDGQTNLVLGGGRWSAVDGSRILSECCVGLVGENGEPWSFAGTLDLRVVQSVPAQSIGTALRRGIASGQGESGLDRFGRELGWLLTVRRAPQEMVAHGEDQHSHDESDQPDPKVNRMHDERPSRVDRSYITMQLD